MWLNSPTRVVDFNQKLCSLQCDSLFVFSFYLSCLLLVTNICHPGAPAIESLPLPARPLSLTPGDPLHVTPGVVSALFAFVLVPCPWPAYLRSLWLGYLLLITCYLWKFSIIRDKIIL